MLIRNYKILVVFLFLLLLPLWVWADNSATPPPPDLTSIIILFTDIGLSVVPLLGAVAFLVFVWGVARFIKAAGSEKEIKDSKNIIIWGIVGLFILISIWGIIAFLRSEFGFGPDIGSVRIIPQIKFN